MYYTLPDTLLNMAGIELQNHDTLIIDNIYKVNH